MYNLTPQRLAALATINWCEGSPDYNEAFGYATFNNYGPHPGTQFPFGNTYTTAHGAYQFLYSTWHDAIAGMGLPDYMSPENQDQCALWLIDVKRKALSYIDAGNFDLALSSLSYEWASLPPGRYGQPIKSEPDVIKYFNDALAYYSGNDTINPVGYNEAVKKKYLLKRGQRLQLSRPFFSQLFTSGILKLINQKKQ